MNREAPDETEGGVGWRGTVLIITVGVGALLLASVLLVGFAGYIDHLESAGTEQACEDKYGQNAEYIGDTSAFGGTGICDTENGQKFVKKQVASIGPGTFGDYLHAVASGDA